MPGGISIAHGDGGLAKIPFEDLPDVIVEKVGGFDKEAAAAQRKALAAAEAKHEKKAIESLTVRSDAANRERLDKDESAAETGAARAAYLEVVQSNATGGSLCMPTWQKRIPVMGKDSFGRTANTGKTQLVDDGSESKNLIMVVGLSGLVDGDCVTVALVPLGNHNYTTALGAGATVRKYKVLGTPTPAEKREIYVPARPVLPGGSMRRIGGG
ncbi:MAG: hypothetical protein V4733_03675 [Verrucomicrobiota bacterium]